MSFRSVVIIVFSVVLFSGISLWYHSPAHFYQFIFHKATATANMLSTSYFFTAEDTGKEAIYPVGKQFTVVLDKKRYPEEELQIVCSHANILERTGNTFFLLPPLYAVHYETAGKGICVVKNKSFSITVKLVDLSS